MTQRWRPRLVVRIRGVAPLYQWHHFFKLPRSSGALAFGWWCETYRIRFRELDLFRALTKTITWVSRSGYACGQLHVEEYHGNAHQVAFGGHGTWARDIARCELSDLLIVVFTPRPSFRARMTFLQAKRSRSTYDFCHDYPDFAKDPNVRFRANLEQWDLLSRRPPIIGVPSFEPPPNLLTGALLPSVGSFGIFHRHHDKSVGFLYASADALHSRGTPRRRYGALEVLPGSSVRTVDGHEEMRLACCIHVFGMGLFNLQIGTPIDYDKTVSTEDEAYRNEARGWVGNIVAAHVSVAEGERPVATSLLRLLEHPPERPFGVLAVPGSLPNALLIQADTEQDRD